MPRSSAAAMACLQGVHAGDGQGRLRRAGKPDMPKNHFTVGINDDVTFTSLDYDPDFSTESDEWSRAVFFGLGSDGTVGANKNSIKIIGEETPNYAQGYFVYDSKKSGSATVSHLRFGPAADRRALPDQPRQLRRLPPVRLPRTLRHAQAGPAGRDVPAQQPLWAGRGVGLTCPRGAAGHHRQGPAALRHRRLQPWRPTRRHGGRRINTSCRPCFFALSGVCPASREAIAEIKKPRSPRPMASAGERSSNSNYAAVDASLAHLHGSGSAGVTGVQPCRRVVCPTQGPGVRPERHREMMAGLGDLLPVSALPVDGTYPTGTTQFEKRNIATEMPEWDPSLCIQCGKCALVCPHAVIRSRSMTGLLEDAPETASSQRPARFKEYKDRLHAAGLPRGLHRLHPVRRSLPGQEQAPGRSTRRSTWRLYAGRARAGAPTGTSSRSCPTSIRPRSGPGIRSSTVPSSWSRCSSSPALRRLWRDALPEAAHPALRRPHGRRQRHRLLVHLRRQPADHPLDHERAGRGPAWSNSPVRGQRRVRPGDAPRLDQHKASSPSERSRKLRELIGAELVDDILEPRIRRADIPLQRKR
jgi:ferredoxin